MTSPKVIAAMISNFLKGKPSVSAVSPLIPGNDGYIVHISNMDGTEWEVRVRRCGVENAG